MKIFLTGRPGCGKSTVLEKIIRALKQRGIKVGGITTPEIRQDKQRIAFAVKNIFTGQQSILASVTERSGPRVGRYRVNIERFEQIALPALDFAQKNCDLICIDELGKMEFFSQKFKAKVQELLSLRKPVLACLHQNYINEFRKYGEVIEVTAENREKLPEEIFTKLSSGPARN